MSNITHADNQLRSFVERLEGVENDIRERQEDRKVIYTEVKSAGFDAKIIRKLIAERRRDKDDLAEEAEMLDTYRRALGMLSDTPLGKSALRMAKLSAGLGAAAGVEGTLRAVRAAEAAE